MLSRIKAFWSSGVALGFRVSMRLDAVPSAFQHLSTFFDDPASGIIRPLLDLASFSGGISMALLLLNGGLSVR